MLYFCEANPSFSVGVNFVYVAHLEAADQPRYKTVHFFSGSSSQLQKETESKTK